MASVSSTNMFSQYGIRNKGVGGLASGLDTDSLVESLTATTRSKIAKQGQTKQLLNWKVSAYRGVANTLRAFQSKYLSYSAGSNTNLASAAFFNTYKSTTSSDKVTVTPGTGATIGDITIDKITSLAQQQTVSGGVTVSRKLEGGVIPTGEDYTDKTLLLNVSGTVKTIKLDTLNGKTGAALQTELQSLINNTFGYEGQTTNPVVKVTVNSSGGQDTLGFASQSGNKITVAGGHVAALGFEGGESNRVSQNAKLSELGLADQLVGKNFRFSINDVEFSFDQNSTISDIMSKVNNSKANVKMTYSAATDKFTVTAKTGGGGTNNIVIKDVEGNLLNTLMGAQAGSAVGSQTLNETSIRGGAFNFDNTKLTQLGSSSFKLTVDGTTKTISISLTNEEKTALSSSTSNEIAQVVIAKVNASIKEQFGDKIAGSVKLEFDPLSTDGNSALRLATTREHTVSVATGTLSSTTYDALGYMGFTHGQNNSLNLGYDSSIEAGSNLAGDLTSLFSQLSAEGGSFMMTVNGVTKEVAFKISSGAEATPEILAKALNESIKTAFGADIAKDITVSAEGGSKIVLTIASNKKGTSGGNTQVSLAATDATKRGDKADLFAAMGFTGSAVNNGNSAQGTKLSDLGIGSGSFTIDDPANPGNPFVISYTGNENVMSFIDKINSAVGSQVASFKDGHLAVDMGSNPLTIKEDPALGAAGALSVLFGTDDEGIAYDSTRYATSLTNTAGKNAEIVVNGQTIYSSSNTFTIDGVSIEINAESTTPIKIGTSYDTDSLVEKLEEFVGEYNVLVESFHKMLKEEKVKGYEPLTDEQRADMTQDQITKWETEAKKGLLRSDSTISRIVGQLRSSLVEKVDGAGISLSDIGITTMSLLDSSATNGVNYKNDGKIKLDTQKLKAYIDKNGPDSVQALFTDKTNGIAKRFDNVITGAANTSSVNRGTLVELAGTETLTGNNTSVLGKQIENVDKLVTNLKSRLKSEYTRYWNKFSALEKAISRMNSQSSWLTQNNQ
ncbi:flagellar filament capping protein FliD [Oscillospiraceae bacterium MB08-C2-2]|nr:flagellar filament capping protein FliD [Oscillospiraceae bacterium MB08-C2-2]